MVNSRLSDDNLIGTLINDMVRYLPSFKMMARKEERIMTDKLCAVRLLKNSRLL